VNVAAPYDLRLETPRLELRLGSDAELVALARLAPRGVPVPHHEVRIERRAWRSPVPVEIAGAERCLPLFGVFRGRG
jgi:hypothetical protein